MRFEEYKKTIKTNKKDFALPMLFLEVAPFEQNDRLNKNLFSRFYNGKLVISQPPKQIIRLL